MTELSKVSKKGLTTIPSKVKKKLGIEEGDYLSWEIVGDSVVVNPVKNPYRFLKGRHKCLDLTFDKVEETADEMLSREVNAGN